MNKSKAIEDLIILKSGCKSAIMAIEQAPWRYRKVLNDMGLKEMFESITSRVNGPLDFLHSIDVMKPEPKPSIYMKRRV